MIYVEIEGGIVQNVFASYDGRDEYVVLDRDNDVEMRNEALVGGEPADVSRPLPTASPSWEMVEEVNKALSALESGDSPEAPDYHEYVTGEPEPHEDSPSLPDPDPQ